MDNLTIFKIHRPAHDVFEAFVDPAKIGNFWFSSSSERWEPGKAIALEYDLVNAKLEIRIVDIEADRKIVFAWGAGADERVITISLVEPEPAVTRIEIREEGFREADPELIPKLIDNKEGWVFMLGCLKAYLEFGANMRDGLVK